MNFEDYYNLLHKIEVQKKSCDMLLRAIENLEKIVNGDKKQTVENRIILDWQYGATYGDYRASVNARNLLCYYKSEFDFQKQTYDILCNRINREELK